MTDRFSLAGRHALVTGASAWFKTGSHVRLGWRCEEG